MTRVPDRLEDALAEIKQLKAALHVLVSHHDYKHLDMGIETATSDGKAWLEARCLVAEPKPCSQCGLWPQPKDPCADMTCPVGAKP